jgi:hypothetical protein
VWGLRGGREGGNEGRGVAACRAHALSDICTAQGEEAAARALQGIGVNLQEGDEDGESRGRRHSHKIPTAA